MIAFFHRQLIRLLYPGSITRLPGDKKVVYLTFDDGPHPEITPKVLDWLSKYRAKATFFLIGSRVQNNTEIKERILNEGHTIGNHTMNHEKGWRTSLSAYTDSVFKTAVLVNSFYFRPPYGKCTIKQFRYLKNSFRFVFWDVLAEDWNPNLKGEQCYNKVVNSCRNGSVIVLHDSVKAWPRLEIALPLILKTLSERGYIFEALPRINNAFRKD
jgi:peptidoglycan/xylan/chitin deacetylase (PgdA/CDA1 family)